MSDGVVTGDRTGPGARSSRFGEVRSSQPQWSTLERRLSAWVFGLGLAFLVASAWWYGRGLWFYSDEWNVIAVHHSGHWTQGFNGQWLLIPTAFFWVLLKAVGLFTYWPFRFVGLAWYVALIVFFHAWARRRVRPFAAAIGALAIAWYSTSWNVVMMPLLMNFTIPAAMLFASWLLLARDTRRGDIGVAGCLVVGVLSSNVGLVVGLMLAVEFLVARVRWRRWWVFVPAVVVWVPWFLIWYEPISKRAKVTHAAHWGMGLTENYARGFFSGWRVGQWVWLAALIAVGVWALARRRWTPRAIGVLAGTAFFVAGASFRAADFHIPIPPDPNWYLWFYSVCVAALLIELVGEVRVHPGVLAGLAVVVLVGGFHLHRSLAEFHSNGLQLAGNARTWFVAVDALGTKVPGDATLPINIVQLPVADYERLRRDMGSLVPGVTLGDLGDEPTRQAADAWMAVNLGIRIDPGPRPVGSCHGAPEAGSSAGVALPAGAVVRVASGKGPVDLRLRRLASGFGMSTIGRIGPGETAHFTIPRDQSPLRWYLQVSGRASVEVCP